MHNCKNKRINSCIHKYNSWMKLYFRSSNLVTHSVWLLDLAGLGGDEINGICSDSFLIDFCEMLVAFWRKWHPNLLSVSRGRWRLWLQLSAVGRSCICEVLSECLIYCGTLQNWDCYPHPRWELDLIRSLVPIKRF